MAEKWRDIVGYDGVYQVSDLGQVRNTQTLKILHPTKLKNGRFYITLSSDGFQRKCTVHNLVGEAFLGECPAGHEIRHKDGDYTRNELTNLEYITAGESEAVRDDNRWVFGEPHKACTNRKRTTVLPRGRICEWPRETRSSPGERQTREARGRSLLPGMA